MSAIQQEFSQAVARLLLKAAELGYGVTLGEAYRTPEQAALNAAKGSGISNSLHTERLAIDLNIFRGSVWLTDGGLYADLGNWWLSQGPAYRWGQLFTHKDGNHFAISPDGARG